MRSWHRCTCGSELASWRMWSELVFTLRDRRGTVGSDHVCGHLRPGEEHVFDSGEAEGSPDGPHGCTGGLARRVSGGGTEPTSRL